MVHEVPGRWASRAGAIAVIFRAEKTTVAMDGRDILHHVGWLKHIETL